MSYNYAPEWLVQNADAIATLESLYNTGDVLVFKDRDINKLKRTQWFYNGILASLAINRPELGHLRKVIRTWLRVEEGEWSLFVGKPSHKMKGGRHMAVNAAEPLVLHTQANEPRPTPDGVVIDKGFDDRTVPLLMLELVKQGDLGTQKIIVTNLNISEPERLLIPSLRRIATDYKLTVQEFDQDEAKIIRGLTLVRG